MQTGTVLVIGRSRTSTTSSVGKQQARCLNDSFQAGGMHRCTHTPARSHIPKGLWRDCNQVFSHLYQACQWKYAYGHTDIDPIIRIRLH